MLIIGLALGIANAQAQPAKPPRVAFLYQAAGPCKPAAGFVDRILKGAKPAALGITMPAALVLRADRTIR